MTDNWRTVPKGQSLPLPPQDYLRACFDADFERGELRWKARPGDHFPTRRSHSVWSHRFPGTLAGAPDNKGYLRVKLEGRQFKVHRILFAMYHGRAPNGVVDHRAGNKRNNAISNLREATKTQNAVNTGLRRDNKTGCPGVKPRGSKFIATIKLNGQDRWLGTFATKEEAISAYIRASTEAHGEFALSSLTVTGSGE